MKLNLGSGNLDPNDTEHLDFTRVDYSPDVNPDLVVNLQLFPWPWEDNSIEEIWCAHYVEHQSSLNWIKFVEEAWRVLIPGHTITIVHPNLQTTRAFADPTHLDYIPGDRWLYANKQWRQEHGMDHPPYPTCNFGITNLIYGNFEPGLELRSDEAQQQAITTRWNSAYDILVTLTKKE